MNRTTCLLLTTILFCVNLTAQFKEKNKDYRRSEGFFATLYDQKTDKTYLEVNRLDTEFLYVYSLSSGIGSNDIGLDRGQLGNEQVVYFTKAGNKLLLIQPNLKFRAITKNKLERQSIEQAFAKSVLAGFTIENEFEGTYTIDISDFLMQDVHGVARRLKKAEQGSYQLDAEKSATNQARTKTFPKNVEFDVLLTLKGEAQGDYIKSVVPNPGLITVNQHHSFIELPDSNFEKRAFDPRCGSYPFSYFDYATPVEQPIEKRFITRHRLAKRNPEAEKSEAVEPLIYYLDNGTPEPIRSALLEGGRWWNQAFEAIGYTNAFQIKILPDDVDPMDVRYNVIQWVHRATRGWSYGASVTDPRTGEIIKGHVSLGSLRIRQDFLIAQALSNQPFAKSDEHTTPMLNFALARIRQLSAHEIGHTLGFAHNFAASTNQQSSVMDYPHPQFTLDKQKIDFSNAYAENIGDWDKFIVAYAYGDIPEQTSDTIALRNLIDIAQQSGLRYITDQDARPRGGAHAFAHLWDNGESASAELKKVLEIRKVAMANFSIDNIRTGEPNSVLEDVFAPLYFFHRYQSEAAIKIIGGLDYDYMVKDDNTKKPQVVDRKTQEKALKSILQTLDAKVIAIPKEKLKLFPPRAFGFPRSRESLKGKTGVSFDALSAPETAADMTLSLLLHPERASRLVQQKALDSKNIGLSEVFDAVISNTFNNDQKGSYLTEVQHNINFRVLFHIMNLAASKRVHPQVNAIAHQKMRSLVDNATLSDQKDPIKAEIALRIKNFFDHPEQFKVLPTPKIPDGSPIGMFCN